jgi:hypothetical protein
MLQLQFDPGSMPVASTSATNVAIGGVTAAGGTTATTVTAAGTTGAVGVTGVAAVTTGGVGAVVVGVVVAGAVVVGVVVRAPAIVRAAVLAECGLENDGDGAREELSVKAVVTAKAEARPMATNRTGRRRKNVRTALLVTATSGPVADPLDEL